LISNILACAEISTKVFVPDLGKSGKEKATIYFHRAGKMMGAAAPVYVFDDGIDVEPNTILAYRINDDSFMWSYINTKDDEIGVLAFGKSRDPEGSYEKYDSLLGDSRSTTTDDELLIRRTTTVGRVESGETIKWMRPPGTFRVSASSMYYSSYFPLSEWLNVEAGKHYLIDFEFFLSGHVDFQFKELKEPLKDPIN
jgi:hypothetical protein